MAREVSILSFVCFTLIGKIPDIEPFVCCFGHALPDAFATRVDGRTIKYSSAVKFCTVFLGSWEKGRAFLCCALVPLAWSITVST